MLLTFDQVVRNTAGSWIEVHRNEALVKVARDQLDAIQALAGLTKERQAKGAGTYSDTAQADARVDAARVMLLTAQSQVKLWRTTLMHWVGTRGLPDRSEEHTSELQSLMRSSY